MNENWPRWFKASVSKYFVENSGGAITYVEGDERDTPQPDDFAEFRMDGPWITSLDGKEYHVRVEVNILVQTAMDGKDAYKHERTIGKVLAAFADSIQVFKLGLGVDDDQSAFACLGIVQDKLNSLRVNNMGRIDPDYRLSQATIEATYETYLEA